MAAETDLPELISSIQALVEGLSADRTKKKEDEGKATAFSGKKLAQSLAKNSVAILGLSQGLTSVKGFFAQAVKDNTQIVKQLSQFTTASRTSTRQLTASLNTGYTTLQEGLATQGELISAGMGEMSKGNKESFIGMKALGANLAGVISITRFNKEAVGLGTAASVDLATSLMETSIANSSSMEALVSAVQSMRAALVKTTVELGPEMTRNVQNVVARMTQGNSELAGAAASFVTSLVSGEEGFMKAAKLGVMFTGQETEDQLAGKIEQISQIMAQMSAGAQGGVQFQRFEDAFGITRENFMVAKATGTDIKDLKRANVSEGVKRMNQLDATRQVQVAAFKLQSLGVDAMQGVASTLAPLGSLLMPGMIALGVIANMTTIMAAKNPLTGADGGVLATMKSRRGTFAWMTALAGAATTINTGIKLKDKEKRTSENIGGTIGGVVLGAVGAAFGGPMGAGFGMTIGNEAGKFIGKQWGEEGTTNSEEATQTLKDAYGIGEQEAKDTAEIRRIQQDQERREKSLANPNLRVLTSINQTLIRNLAVLERTAGLANRGNELAEDAKFAGLNSGAPSLGAIANF